MRRTSQTIQRWRATDVLAAVAMLAIAVAVTSGAWQDLILIAIRDEEASHIFLVPIAAAWIAWMRREALLRCQPRGHMLGAVLIAIGWFLWTVGYHQDIQCFWHGGAVVMAVGAAISVLGAEVLRRAWPAFVVLVFLVPVPGMLRQSISQPLQTMTAHATQSVAEIIGLQVDRWGNGLVVNGREVTVAEACNGMRMVFALFLVSYLFAFITPLRPYVRLLVLAACPITAVCCNVIRLVPTVWLYGHLSAEAAGRFHDISGWAMVVVGFLILGGIVKVLKWAMLPVMHYSLATSA
ncbi:exosortase/archaeosortase family protein [Fontivita pretiosa]|uniref:exosortase/archaeosortase family protein n=1 Tax=Fontivita pretiosa TaxID=2989684 RepID=UPI003D17F5B6